MKSSQIHKNQNETTKRLRRNRKLHLKSSHSRKTEAFFCERKKKTKIEEKERVSK